MTIYFTEDHEWIRVEGDIGTIGITDHAQDQLGDITFVELPEVGDDVEQGDEACAVESVKAAGEVKAPADGEVTEVNDNLEDDAALLNTSPEDEGWIFKIKIADASQLDTLMDEAAYRDFIA